MINNPVLGGLGNESGSGYFGLLLPKLITFILIIGGVVFFFIFASGAIQWITSSGEKQALESARAKITNGLIGIVLLFVAFAIITFIGKFFGIDILTIDTSTLIIQK